MIIFLSLIAVLKLKLSAANVCYQKCCPSGEVYNLLKKCAKYSNFGDNFRRNIVYFPDEVLLQANGSILIDSNTLIDTNGYCAERLEFFNYSIVFLVCHTVNSSGPKIDIYLVGNENLHVFSVLMIRGLLVSVVFLLATVFVYTVVPKLRNLHGKCMISYILSLTSAYLLLGFAQFPYVSTLTLCKLLGLLIYYCFLSSFFWLNAICFDIWWTFSGHRGFNYPSLNSKKKEFLYYNLYAWGTPLIILGTVICTDYLECIPENWLKADFGRRRCFFSNDLAQFVYLCLPIILIMISNVLMFTWCVFKISCVQKSTQVYFLDAIKGAHFKQDRENLKLYTKLVFIMGLNWIFEITSWIIDLHVWFLTDLVNILYGVIIFIIFACKTKNWHSITK